MRRMKKPSARFAMNLTEGDRDLIGEIAEFLDLNFREAIRFALRAEMAALRAETAQIMATTAGRRKKERKHG